VTVELTAAGREAIAAGALVALRVRGGFAQRGHPPYQQVDFGWQAVLGP
jgi:hypothetical protein